MYEARTNISSVECLHFDGVNMATKEEWGRYPGGYSTFGVSYGLSKPAFGISLSRTETRFFKD